MMGTMKTDGRGDVVIEGHRRTEDGAWVVTWLIGNWLAQELGPPVDTEATVVIRGSQWGPRHDHTCQVEIADDLPDHVHRALESYLADVAGTESP